jgi:SAM-dependent methyltransferase
LKLDRTTLDEFFSRSEQLGGPGTVECQEFWQGLIYEPLTLVDKQLAPTSETYLEQQMKLYEEITGHGYNDVRDEDSGFLPLSQLICAPNAYDAQNPADYAKHCVAMGLLVGELGLPRGATILELGSGWGFSQEFLSACGFKTIGVEINPNFVCASNARLSRLGFGSRVREGSFELFDVADIGHVDAVVTYEAFHHAVNTKAMLQKYSSVLKDGGMFALAAEPFNDYYKTWGLRLDPYSIYCIKKYGWFESGWSAEYMAYLLGLCGLEARFWDPGINNFTRYMIGRKSGRLNGYQLGMWHPAVAEGWWANWEFLCCRGKSLLLAAPPPAAARLALQVTNFNIAPLAVTFGVTAGRRENYRVETGEAELLFELPTSPDGTELMFQLDSETYCPARLGINADARELGIHVRGLRWVY